MNLCLILLLCWIQLQTPMRMQTQIQMQTLMLILMRMLMQTLIVQQMLCQTQMLILMQILKLIPKLTLKQTPKLMLKQMLKLTLDQLSTQFLQQNNLLTYKMLSHYQWFMEVKTLLNHLKFQIINTEVWLVILTCNMKDLYTQETLVLKFKNQRLTLKHHILLNQLSDKIHSQDRRITMEFEKLMSQFMMIIQST